MRPNSTLKSKHPRVIDLAIPLALTVVILGPLTTAAYWRWAQFRAAAFFWMRNAGLCSLSEAIKSPSITAAQFAEEQRILGKIVVASHDAAGYALVATPRGSFWIPQGSERSMAYDLAEQVREIYRSGAVGVQRGDVVLDCGANIGVYTREALARGAALVIAIEPAPENLECLRRNLETEVNERRVVIVPKGVWDKDATLPMFIDRGNPAADTFLRSGDRGSMTTLPLTTIDQITTDLKLHRVDFIKMDIEGAERQAIAGGGATLRRFRPRLAIAAYHLPDDQTVLPRLIKGFVADYRLRCNCRFYGDYVAPEVMFFY